jgi:hypothetical protein
MLKHIYSQKGKHKGNNVTVISYYCTQLDGEQSKKHLHEDPSKRRARTQMRRYSCEGRLTITIYGEDRSRARVRMGHSEAHPHYVDISIPVKIQELITEMKNSSASKVGHDRAPTNGHLLTSVTRYGTLFLVNTEPQRLHKNKSTHTGSTSTKTAGGWLTTRLSQRVPY